MQYLSTPLELVEIKADSGGRMEFSAYASTFGNKDHGGDVIQKGAFRESLKARSFRPLLWQHDMAKPIGIEKSIKEDGRGLLGTWELIDTAQGIEAYKLLKAGAVRSMSIGYVPKDFDLQFADGSKDPFDATRLLKTVDLLENSVVSLPMNEQAQVQSVKQLKAMIREAVLEAIPNAKTDPEPEEEDDTAVSYESMTLAQLASVVTEVVGAFGERTKDLLSKLTTGDLSLTEAKRTDLQALLETFSSFDAVRHEAEAVLAHQPKTDPQNTQTMPTALGLAIALRKHRMRARGMEI